MVAIIKVTKPSQKTHKTSSYACHICGLNGHKMTDCPKFAKMQKMFHGKFVTIIEVQLVVETQAIMADVNVVNVTIRNKVTILVDTQKSQEVMNSQGKLIIVEEIFLDIGKKVLKPSYTLNLGKLLKIALELKRYLEKVETRENSKCK
jgi:hypothetical protein